MVKSLPWGVRVAVGADRALAALVRVERAVVDELMWAMTPPQGRDAITAGLFAAHLTYAPGGGMYERGWMPWERRALASPDFPPRGHVLLTAAGGGREAVLLARAGYRVTAFEPSDLVEGARQAASGLDVSVERASYRDLVDAAQHRRGPLASIVGAQFDAVILGWGSVNHLHSATEREEVLGATRLLAPSAPVLCSFMEQRADLEPRVLRVRRVVRALLRGAGARSTGTDLTHFSPHSGFYTVLARGEIRASAERAGYRVAMYESAEYPHALLVPVPAAPLR